MLDRSVTGLGHRYLKGPDDTLAESTLTVAEVEELVEVGELDPNEIHTPGIYVQRIFQGKDYEKRIEQRTTRIK